MYCNFYSNDLQILLLHTTIEISNTVSKDLMAGVASSSIAIVVDVVFGCKRSGGISKLQLQNCYIVRLTPFLATTISRSFFGGRSRRVVEGLVCAAAALLLCSECVSRSGQEVSLETFNVFLTHAPCHLEASYSFYDDYY